MTVYQLRDMIQLAVGSSCVLQYLQFFLEMVGDVRFRMIPHDPHDPHDYDDSGTGGNKKRDRRLCGTVQQNSRCVTLEGLLIVPAMRHTVRSMVPFKFPCTWCTIKEKLSH